MLSFFVLQMKKSWTVRSSWTRRYFVTWSVPVFASWYTDKTEQDLKVVFFTLYLLTLNAPIATKVVCFSRLLKCLRSLYGKQCGPRSDCSYRSSLFWVHAVCFYTVNRNKLLKNKDFSPSQTLWCCVCHVNKC